MQYRKKALITGALLLCSIGIHLYSADRIRVEQDYSLKTFPLLSRILRSAFGNIPFSIGDILYAAVFIFLLITIFKFLRNIFSRRKNNGGRYNIKGNLISIVMICSLLYIIFNILWGINYNRIGIAGQLGLKSEKYSIEELKTINKLLAEKINESKRALLLSKTLYPGNRQLFLMTVNAYKNIAGIYPFLEYNNPSLKSSVWSSIGNFTGFVGYYNPFTGEAQVNTTVPAFTQPFTACHETAHQLGYAKEEEANFVGYLAAASSTDTMFHYSVYADLFSYANRTLYFADSSAAKNFRKKLLPEVIADFKARNKFNKEHTSFAEPIFRKLYGVFLKSNKQPMGILSYDEVTAFIIAYYKKFGKI